MSSSEVCNGSCGDEFTNSGETFLSFTTVKELYCPKCSCKITSTDHCHIECPHCQYKEICPGSQYCKEEKHKCLMCNYFSNDLHQFKQHELEHVHKYLEPLVQVHEDSEVAMPTFTEFKVFACELCSFKAKSNSSLKDHRLTHIKSKRFQCSFCSYETNKIGNLNRHESLHKDTTKYKCDKCEFETKVLVYFKRHEKSHSLIKKFKCSQCEYGTNNICNLKRHETKHVLTKDLKCSQCDYKTNCASYLKRHVLTHSVNKRFNCPSCSYGTNNKSHLRDHLRTHLKKLQGQ